MDIDAYDIDKRQFDEFDEDDDEEVDENGEKPHPLKKIYGQLEGYMTQLPVSGFNSAKYDLNLIKKYLARQLHLHSPDQEGAFVIKKNDACVATEQLKFLETSQYLTAGLCYACFLKAYKVKEQKGYFPYEWFSDVTKLEETSLPPHEAFYSSHQGAILVMKSIVIADGCGRNEACRLYVISSNGITISTWAVCAGDRTIPKVLFRQGNKRLQNCHLCTGGS